MRLGTGLALTWPLFAGGTLAAQRPCGAAAAESTFTVTSAPPGVWSDGTAGYADDGGCFVVEFRVANEPARQGSNPTVRFEAGARVSAAGWKLGEHFSIPDVPELCGVYAPWGPEPQYQQTTTIYRRRPREREFTLLASRVTTGTWSYTTCQLQLPSWEYPQPIAGTDVYRVGVRVKAGKSWRPVRIRAIRSK